MIACPNIHNEDYKYAVEKLGKHSALYLYDLLGQEIPTKVQVDNFIIGSSVSGKDVASKSEIIDKALEIGGVDFAARIKFVDDFKNNPDAVGRYYEGVAEFILGRATMGTATHESIHYFLDKLISQEEYDFLQKVFGEDIEGTSEEDLVKIDERITDAAVAYYAFNKISFISKINNIFRNFWNSIKKIFTSKVTDSNGKKLTVSNIFDKIGKVHEILNKNGNLKSYWSSLNTDLVSQMNQIVPLDNYTYELNKPIVTEEVTSTDSSISDPFNNFDDEYLNWYNSIYKVREYKGTEKSKIFRKDEFSEFTLPQFMQYVYADVKKEQSDLLYAGSDITTNIFGKGSKIEITSRFLEHLKENPNQSTNLTIPFTFSKATKFENKVLKDFYDEYIEQVKNFFESKGQQVPKSVKNDRLFKKLQEFINKNYALEYYLTPRGGHPYGLNSIIKNPKDTKISGSEIFISNGLVHREADAHSKMFIDPKTGNKIGSFNSLGWYIYTDINDDLFIYEYQSDILDNYEKVLNKIKNATDIYFSQFEVNKDNKNDERVTISFHGSAYGYEGETELTVNIKTDNKETVINHLQKVVIGMLYNRLEQLAAITSDNIIKAEKYKRGDLYVRDINSLKNRIKELNEKIKVISQQLYHTNIYIASMSLSNNKRKGIINKIIRSTDLKDDKDVVDLLDNLNRVGGKLFTPVMKHLYTTEIDQVVDANKNEKLSETVKSLLSRSDFHFADSWGDIFPNYTDSRSFDYHGLRITYNGFFKVLNIITQIDTSDISSRSKKGTDIILLYQHLTKNLKLTEDQLRSENIYNLIESRNYKFLNNALKKLIKEKRNAEYREYLYELNNNLFDDINNYYIEKRRNVQKNIQKFGEYILDNSSLIETKLQEIDSLVETIFNPKKEIKKLPSEPSSLYIVNDTTREKFEHLYKTMFEKFLMHSFIIAKNNGKNILYLPTATSMYEIEGSKSTALIYSGPNDNLESIGVKPEKVEIKQVGPFYTALSKIKGVKIIAYEKPNWSRYNLLKVDITDFDPNKFERFHEIKSTEERKKKFLDRANSRIKNGMYEERDGTLVPVTDDYNPETWWVENEEKLVTFKGGRKDNLFTFDKVNEKVSELKNKYEKEGYSFRRDQAVFTVGEGQISRNKNFSRNDRKIWRIIVTKPLSGIKESDESIITRDDIINSLRETETLINETFDKIKSFKSLDNLFDYLNTVQFPEEQKALLNIIKARLVDNPTLKIVVSEELSDKDGTFDPNTNTITLYRFPHLEGDRIGLSEIGSTLLHELLHAFTSRAIHNTYSDAEREFVTTMERLYSIAKKQSKYVNDDGYSNLEEFVASILTNPDMMKEAMKMKLNLWQRFLRALHKFITGSSVYDAAFQTAVEYIGKADTFKIDLTKGKYRILNKVSDVAYSGDEISPEVIVNRLGEFSSMFEYNPVTRSYKQVRNYKGEELPEKEQIVFESAHEMLLRYKVISAGYLGKNPDTAKRNAQKKAVKEGINSVVNLLTDADIKETAVNIADAQGFTYDERVIKQISDILKQFKGKTLTTLSQVLVADVDLQVATTIDLVVIDKNTNVNIYKFVTSTTGFAKYNTKTNPNRGDIRLSDKERDTIDLTISKDFFEKITGKQCAINIVTLKAQTEGVTVVDIKRDLTFSKTKEGKETNKGVIEDIKPMASNAKAVYRFREDSLRDNSGEYFNEFDSNKPDPSLISSEDEFITQGLADMYKDVTTLSKRQEIVIESLKALAVKRHIAYRSENRNMTFDIELIESTIDKVMAEKDVEKQLGLIVEFAHRTARRIQREYTNYKEEGTTVPISILRAWRSSILAFDALLNEENGLNAIITKEIGTKDGPKYRDALRTTMEVGGMIKSLYADLGTEQLVDYLAPFYHMLYAQMRLLKTKEYRRKKFLGKLTDDVSEYDYVESALTENEEDLQEQTRNLLRKELKKASRDVSLLTRWIDNLLDTKDPITAAMIKAFVYTDENSRLESLDKRDELISIVREVEDWYREHGGIPKSMEDFYDFMLEKDTDHGRNEYTGYITSEYKSTLIKEYKAMLQRSRDIADFDARKDFRKVWLDENWPLDGESFRKEYWKYIDDQYDKGYISENEYTNLKENDTYQNRATVNQMAEMGAVSTATGTNLNRWLSEHVQDFRVPISRYINPQYEALYKILQDETDPRGKLYMYIKRMSMEADSFLPFGFALSNRMPGVVKQNYERVKSGQSIGSIIRGAISRELTFKVDDTSRIHEELITESGEARYFLPVHFTGTLTEVVEEVTGSGKTKKREKLNEKEQSFDLANIYFKYWEMANDYNHKAQILPEMELAKFMIERRPTTKRDSFGQVVMTSIGRIFGREETVTNTNLAEQLNDWFLSCVYGMYEKEFMVGKTDVTKILNFVNKYTSLNLLGLNFIASAANVILGETLQHIESFAMEYMSPKDFLYADKFYARTFAGVIGDIGSRSPVSLGTKLIEYFGILDDYGTVDSGRRTRMGQLFNMDTLYSTTRMGEHYMQSRFLFGMLANKTAIDLNGNPIGRMLDQYEVRNGKLKLKQESTMSELDYYKFLEKNKWTEDDIKAFKVKVRGILSRLHGEYSELGRVAIQRSALGRMAYLFRHFVVPGFRRRWGKSMYETVSEIDPETKKMRKVKKLRAEAYSERLQQFIEGNYVTTGRYVGNTVGTLFTKNEEHPEYNFFEKFISNLQSFKLSIFKAEWSELTDHEKANIQRTIYEAGFLVIAVIMANILMRLKSGADDEDDEITMKFYSFLAYQAYRLQNELLFFTPKLDSTTAILRSPAASMSVLENIIKLSGQIFHPMERYETGAWKGRLKIIKTLTNMTPIERQFYRLFDIDTQLPWMYKASITGTPSVVDEKNKK